MKKTVIIINGRGGVGKDTICDLTASFCRVKNISSITPIVRIARFAGWNGEKTLAARRMLSQLKEVFTEFNDLSFTYCMEQYAEFLKSDEDILFIHIREPEEIARLRQAIGADCKTLLVRRSDPDQTVYGNRSDDSVEKFDYDLYFENNVPLSELPEAVEKFFDKILKSC